MIISTLTLFKSPFDASYSNVPSHYAGVTEKAGSLKTYLYNWLNKNAEPTTIRDIKADAFADNLYEKVIIKISDTMIIREKNYCVLVTDDPNDTDKFFFITSYNLLNAMREPTIELTLQKDIWVECYDTACIQNNAKFAITQQHLNMISSDGYIGEQYQNIVNDDVGVVVHSIEWANPMVLWAVYKCDPTVNFYAQERSNDYKLGNNAPNPSYGTYRYFYYAVGVVQRGYLSPVGRPYDGNSYSLYFPRVEGSYLLSQQLTIHPPFEYTMVERSGGGYNVMPATAHNPIFYLYGTTEYRSIDSWGADYDRNEYTEFCYYNEDTTTTVRQYHYQYIPDNTQNGDYYNTIDDLPNSPYMKAYPFTYYSISLPGGKDIKFDTAIPIGGIDIYITPTDSGGIITVNATTTDNNAVLIANQTFTNYEVTGDIPRSVNAYLDYMARAGAALNEQKQYALRANTLRTNQQISNALYKSFQNTVVGVTETAAYAMAPKKKLKAKAIASGVYTAVHVGDGAAEAGDSIANYRLEKDHINNAYNAKMSDLGTTTVTRFQANNQLNTSPFWDMPVVYKHTVINNDINKCYQLNFIKYGTECQRVDNPLIDYRYYFNFVKAVNPNFTSIGNVVYRDIFNAILAQGVTKWNIATYDSNVLDWFVDNKQL